MLYLVVSRDFAFGIIFSLAVSSSAAIAFRIGYMLAVQDPTPGI